MPARLRELRGSLVCQAVVYDVALLFRPAEEIVRVMETTSDAAVESVSQDLRFCVWVGGDVPGSWIQTARSQWCQVVDVPVMMLDKCMRSSREATPSSAIRVVWKTASTTAASARRSSEGMYKAWRGLPPISEMFTFHGGYKVGNMELQPELWANFQKFVSLKAGYENPLFIVFHDGSWSREAAFRLLSSLAS